MDFQELGLTLQREREARGLTIEAVMEATKISRINLVALEQGDRSALPHPVYTKGFIKSYARLLGLDGAELSMVVDREYQAEAPEVESVAYDVSPTAEKAFQEVDAPKKRKRPVWPSILVFLAVAVAVVLFVLNLNNGQQRPTPVPEPAATEQPAEQNGQADEPVVPEQEEAAPVPEEKSVPAAETPSTDEGSPADVAAPAPEAAPADGAASEDVAQEPAAEVQVQSAQAETADEAEAVAQEAAEEAESVAATDQATDEETVRYAHVLIIRATTDKGCWIGLWKNDDPNMARDFVLKKGEPLRLMFNNPRRIRIGNAAGVDVTYNGEPYPLEKTKSNIQTLVFGRRR